MPQAAPLSEGQAAPLFALRDKDGNEYQLSNELGRTVVLFFYPKDNTPGCTLETQGFDKRRPEFEAAGAAVWGISGGDQKSKAKFCSKFGFTIPLLSDPEFKVAQAYGVYGERSFMGRKFLGIHRTTFIVSPEGVILRVFKAVKPDGHEGEVLEAVQALSGLRLRQLSASR
jgi:peroxiredoxin Q/BCP